MPAQSEPAVRSVSFIAANTKRTFSLFDDHRHYMAAYTRNTHTIQVFTHAKCERAHVERYVNTWANVYTVYDIYVCVGKCMACT